jgi:hypothetical protein
MFFRAQVDGREFWSRSDSFSPAHRPARDFPSNYLIYHNPKNFDLPPLTAGQVRLHSFLNTQQRNQATCPDLGYFLCKKISLRIDKKSGHRTIVHVLGDLPFLRQCFLLGLAVRGNPPPVGVNRGIPKIPRLNLSQKCKFCRFLLYLEQ